MIPIFPYASHLLNGGLVRNQKEGQVQKQKQVLRNPGRISEDAVSRFVPVDENLGVKASFVPETLPSCIQEQSQGRTTLFQTMTSNGATRRSLLRKG